MQKTVKTLKIAVADLHNNDGQVAGLPKNPRIKDYAMFQKLVKSLQDDPEMLELRELIVYDNSGENVVICGNMRLDALREIGETEAWCKVLPVETTVEKLMAYSAKDNISYGKWDFDLLAGDWDVDLLGKWGIEFPEIEPFSYQQDEDGKRELKDFFVVPPFSILDTTSELWLNRRKVWSELVGDLSATRDGENGMGTIGGTDSDGLYASINDGTSHFDPVLAEVLLKWFGIPSGKVLDPFGGEQSKGVVCGELGYDYHGVEIRADQIKTNEAQCVNYAGVHYYQGDSNNIDTLIAERDFDFCFTSPPYYDLEVYSKTDMSALPTYDKFMEQFKAIFAKCYAMLNSDRFLAIKVGEIRDRKTGVYRNFVGDTVRILQDIGFKYYNELILLNSVGNTRLTAGKQMNASRKVGKRHQNVLVFYKGDPKKIKQNYDEIIPKNEAYESES